MLSRLVPLNQRCFFNILNILVMKSQSSSIESYICNVHSILEVCTLTGSEHHAVLILVVLEIIGLIERRSPKGVLI